MQTDNRKFTSEWMNQVFCVCEKHQFTTLYSFFFLFVFYCTGNDSKQYLLSRASTLCKPKSDFHVYGKR